MHNSPQIWRVRFGFLMLIWAVMAFVTASVLLDWTWTDLQTWQMVAIDPLGLLATFAGAVLYIRYRSGRSRVKEPGTENRPEYIEALVGSIALIGVTIFITLLVWVILDQVGVPL